MANYSTSLTRTLPQQLIAFTWPIFPNFVRSRNSCVGNNSFLYGEFFKERTITIIISKFSRNSTVIIFFAKINSSSCLYSACVYVCTLFVPVYSVTRLVMKACETEVSPVETAETNCSFPTSCALQVKGILHHPLHFATTTSHFLASWIQYGYHFHGRV